MAPPQLKVVDQPPDDDRAQLRQAIAGVAQANLAIDDVRAAQGRLTQRAIDAHRRVVEAKAALDSARSGDRSDRLALLMANSPAPDDHRVELLRRALDNAHAEENALANDDEQILADALAAARERLHQAEHQRTLAVAHVLQPLAQSVIDQIIDLRRKANTLQRSLEAFPVDAIPDDSATAYSILNPEGGYEIANDVATLAQNLAQDPGTPVPAGF